MPDLFFWLYHLRFRRDLIEAIARRNDAERQKQMLFAPPLNKNRQQRMNHCD